MSEAWHSFTTDPRTPCRYASKCYQKSIEHQRKFKHPPKNFKRKNCDSHQYDKRPKVITEDQNRRDVEEEPDVPKAIDSEVPESTTAISKTSPEKSELSSPTGTVNVPDHLLYHDGNANDSLVKEIFLLEMPPDFYKFYECLKREESMEKILSSVNLQLIGPYDLLLGKLPVVDKELYLVHWRFFYDPPEFQVSISNYLDLFIHIFPHLPIVSVFTNFGPKYRYLTKHLNYV